MTGALSMAGPRFRYGFVDVWKVVGWGQCSDLPFYISYIYRSAAPRGAWTLIRARIMRRGREYRIDFANFAIDLLTKINVSALLHR